MLCLRVVHMLDLSYNEDKTIAGHQPFGNCLPLGENKTAFLMVMYFFVLFCFVLYCFILVNFDV